MQIPTPRFSGPVEQRDATIVLTLTAFWLAARLPMGFVMLALGPAVVIAVQGLRRHTGLRVALLVALVGSMLVTATLSGVLHPSVLGGAGSFTCAVAVALLVVATMFTGRPRRALDRLFDGLYLGLLFHWALSMAEAVTGVKMLPLLYPGANTAAAVAKHRFFVTSMFPNYNDYSVAMTLLVCILLTRMLFHRASSGLVRLARVLVVCTATFEVAYMGSRGCVIAIAAIALLLVVVNIRSLHPHALTVRHAAFALVALLVAVAGLAVSPLMADNSTFQRGVIAQNVFSMIGHEPMRGLVGWGSLAAYQKDAADVFGPRLMDPHNLLLEVVIWFGIPTLLVWLACWWRVLRHGLMSRDWGNDWRGIAATVMVVAYPLLGVVPSSTLRYYLVWLFTVVAVGLPAVARRDRVRQGVAA